MNGYAPAIKKCGVTLSLKLPISFSRFTLLLAEGLGYSVPESLHHVAGTSPAEMLDLLAAGYTCDHHFGLGLGTHSREEDPLAGGLGGLIVLLLIPVGACHATAGGVQHLRLVARQA